MLRTVLWFSLVGLLVAITIEFLWQAAGYTPTGYALERLARVVWPSSIFKMALGTEKAPMLHVVFVYAASFLANAVLYGFVGVIFGLIRIALRGKGGA